MEEIFKTHTCTCSRLKCELTCYKYQDFRTIQKWLEADTLLQQIFEPEPEPEPEPANVLLCGSPGTGTSWLKALAFAILTRQKLDKPTCSPLVTTSLVATHLPYASLPRSVTASDCKIVYIYRNVQDVMVSHYHLMRESLRLPMEAVPFEEFRRCVSFDGPYWDHVMGYWKASLERPGKILFLKYDDLKRDPVNSVKKLAEFMRCPFLIEEVKAGVVDNVIRVCGENLSNLEVNICRKCRPEEPSGMKKRFFQFWTIGRTTSRL
ncbi:hypothetical protein SSX86_021901 [Deinandra increscens subsp. villosa]|uniref:Sulfotransferase n=1 Tax=Deinandra increscens subsp. villosa TaxID=3103831 RepID=A0AAP0CS74_9ASTR